MTPHHNTTPAEFLDWLRDAAIDGKLPPVVIDKIDELYALESCEGQIEVLGDEIAGLKEGVDSILDELHNLYDSLVENLSDEALESIKYEMERAKATLDRHEGV